MKHDEHDIQSNCVAWARLFEKKLPGLELLYAIPNGGKRNKREAARLKKEGVLSGIPDLCLPVPRHGHGALYIEIKMSTGRHTKEQKDVMSKLEKYGNMVITCRSVETFIECVTAYLKG